MEIGSTQWKNIIRQGAQALGVDVSPEQADGFSTHARELIKWNQKFNLTAIADPFEIAESPHFAGCKSWVDLRNKLPTGGLTPILDHADFDAMAADVRRRLRNT